MYNSINIANNWKAINEMANNYGYAVKGFDFDIEKLRPRQMS
jgi:hypothetical protein